MHPILSLKGSIFGSSNGGTINVFNLMEETVHVVVKGGNKISPHENFYTKKQILFQSEKIELQSPTPLFIKDN